MPADRRARVAALLGDGASGGARADQIGTVVELGLDDLVVGAVGAGAEAERALVRTANEAAADADRARLLEPARYAALLTMEAQGALSATQAKTVLGDMLDDTAAAPEELARRRGFEALADDSLAAVVERVVAEHPEEWARYCAGVDKVAGFFTGAVMRATEGRANGKAVAAELRRLRG